MASKISLKHNSATFFKEQLANFKKGTQDCLKLLKTDVNSISLDSTQTFNLRPSENVLTSAIPHNFYDEMALNEAKRGDSYAVFPELQGESVTVFAIKDGLVERGVLDNFLQDRVINLILQCRGAIHFGIAQPFQQLAAQNEIIASPETQSVKLTVEVLNSEEVILKIEMPIQTLDSRLGVERLGIVHCELNITKSSIYLNEMTYTKTSNSNTAESLFQAVSEDYSWLSELWSDIKRFFGIIEKEAEFELSLAPTI